MPQVRTSINHNLRKLKLLVVLKMRVHNTSPESASPPERAGSTPRLKSICAFHARRKRTDAGTLGTALVCGSAPQVLCCDAAEPQRENQRARNVAVCRDVGRRLDNGERALRRTLIG